jgi:hypothetical protein
MRLADLRFVLAASLLTALPAVVHAQWSSDPANNLVIADRDNEQVQAKIVPTADGGFYISWFDNADGGYDVYLQRVDAGGNEQWAHDGVLVADRDFSSTQDYGLDIDADGNALLAYRLNVSGVAQIAAQKVAPDGTLLWASPGVIVSSDSGDANAPKISAAGDGNVFVAWSSSEGSVAVQKLDGDGNALWSGSGITIDPTTGFFFMSDIHGDTDGNAVVSWVPYIGQSHELWAQKLAAADGSNLWGTDPVEVFDGTGGALQFGNFPYFIPDGSGGAVFVWYTVGATGEVRAQHVMSDGTQAFDQNGALASTDDSQEHFEPDGAYDAASGDIYALWRETDVLTQSQIGVYAQRFDSTGARQWGDGGLVLVPLSTIDQTEMTALAVPGGGLVAAWSSDDFPDPTPLHAARLDTDGNYVWASQVVDFSTEPNDTARLAGAVSTDGYFAYAWTASAASFAGDIHAQNVNPDGTLGVPVDNDTIFANGFDP